MLLPGFYSNYSIDDLKDEACGGAKAGASSAAKWAPY
jgi:hypothetical protein